jgi:hypothetical protein
MSRVQSVMVPISLGLHHLIWSFILMLMIGLAARTLGTPPRVYVPILALILFLGRQRGKARFPGQVLKRSIAVLQMQSQKVVGNVNFSRNWVTLLPEQPLSFVTTSVQHTYPTTWFIINVPSTLRLTCISCVTRPLLVKSRCSMCRRLADIFTKGLYSSDGGGGVYVLQCLTSH